MKWIFLCALLVLALGCAHTEQSRFYVLNSLAASGAQNAERQDVVLGIGPIKMPEYLDRPQIMTRTEGNELDYTEFHKWAEPLKDNFSRVLGENLSTLIPTNRIFFFPWRRAAQVNHKIAADVIRFEGALGGVSTLSVRWTLYRIDDKGRENGARHEKIRVRSRQATGPDYNSTVSALNQNLEAFSREVAAGACALILQPLHPRPGNQLNVNRPFQALQQSRRRAPCPIPAAFLSTDAKIEPQIFPTGHSRSRAVLRLALGKAHRATRMPLTNFHPTTRAWFQRNLGDNPPRRRNAPGRRSRTGRAHAHRRAHRQRQDAGGVLRGHRRADARPGPRRHADRMKRSWSTCPRSRRSATTSTAT